MTVVIRRPMCRIRLWYRIFGILTVIITASILKSKFETSKWIKPRPTKNDEAYSRPPIDKYTGVIILTYMRSGSSLTGDILQQDSDVFYVFEPFRILQNLIKHEKPVQWFNGTISVVNSLNAADFKRQTLVGWLSCNFSLIYSQSIDDLGFLAFGQKTALYRTCILKNYNSTIIDSGKNISRLNIWVSAYHRGLHDKCLQSLQTACLSSKVRIVKTIRTSMLDAEVILSQMRWCRVVNVIRDPRATVLSQLRNDGCSDERNVSSDCAKRHCDSVWNDVITKESMERNILMRVLTIHYEQILANPTLVTKIMYDFIGIKLSEQINSYVRRIVLERNLTGCKICEQSWQVGSRFKTITMFGKTNNILDLSVIESICKNVIKYHNYTVDFK